MKTLVGFVFLAASIFATSSVADEPDYDIQSPGGWVLGREVNNNEVIKSLTRVGNMPAGNLLAVYQPGHMRTATAPFVAVVHRPHGELDRKTMRARRMTQAEAESVISELAASLQTIKQPIIRDFHLLEKNATSMTCEAHYTTGNSAILRYVIGHKGLYIVAGGSSDTQYMASRPLIHDAIESFALREAARPVLVSDGLWGKLIDKTAETLVTMILVGVIMGIAVWRKNRKSSAQ